MRLTTLAAALVGALAVAGSAEAQGAATAGTLDINFTSHDGHAMRGKLTLPATAGRHAIVVFVQTAEAQNVDSRVSDPRGGSLDFFDFYRRELPALDVAFFSYEGRGARTGDRPPRYVEIDRPVYNTSTLENQVRDAMTAVRLLQKQDGVDASRIFLTGMSEGTLLAAETAARMPGEIKGLALAAVVTTLEEAMKFMMTDGAFWQHQGHWDANRDGTITPAEFAADPRGIRKLMTPGVELSQFDADKSGVYTVEDARRNGQPLVDAVGRRDEAILNRWLQATALVDTPDGWVLDHLRHAPIDAFLTKFDGRVGFFHGDADQLTPATEVPALEVRLKAAGRSSVEFRYFPGLDHSLGGLQYFRRGKASDGFLAMLDFFRREAR